VRGGLATDFGFGHVAGVRAGGFVGAGHYTRAWSGGVVAARGVAVRGGFYRYGAFGRGWWGAHPLAWRPYGWGAARYWGWSTWPALSTWFGWTAPPVYYDYGSSIVYQGDQVYMDDQPGPTAADYYQQAVDLADSAPPPPREEKEEEWRPLGVFALVQGDQTDPTAVFQLAVNKAGIVRGNYSNTHTDTTLPVRGAVDRKTQRVSWIVGDKKSTVYDTGLYNLTKDQAPLLIHLGKERTEQWLLVRINEKDTKAPPRDTEREPDLPAPEDGEGTCRVTVIVPADADVTFNGVETTVPGTERAFVTPPLKKGREFHYTVRARWTRNGKPVDQTRKITVKAGTRVRVDFTGPEPSTETSRDSDNPYTGTTRGRANYNPYTGAGGGTSSERNPYTGNAVGGMASSNPYTGTALDSKAWRSPTRVGNRTFKTYSNLSTGTHLEQESVTNPYTGGYRTSTSGYNDYTGRSSSRTIEANPYTGHYHSTGNLYNEYTGANADFERSYNPYTGT
jgi:uncharacterized protein (TIGR03000 family)